MSVRVLDPGQGCHTVEDAGLELMLGSWAASLVVCVPSEVYVTHSVLYPERGLGHEVHVILQGQEKLKTDLLK